MLYNLAYHDPSCSGALWQLIAYVLLAIVCFLIWKEEQKPPAHSALPFPAELNEDDAERMVSFTFNPGAGVAHQAT